VKQTFLAKLSADWPFEGHCIAKQSSFDTGTRGSTEGKLGFIHVEFYFFSACGSSYQSLRTVQRVSLWKEQPCTLHVYIRNWENIYEEYHKPGIPTTAKDCWNRCWDRVLVTRSHKQQIKSHKTKILQIICITVKNHVARFQAKTLAKTYMRAVLKIIQ